MDARAVNLIANLAFTPIQFGLRNLPLAALDIAIVWITILWAMNAIWPYHRWITVAQIPYLIWVTIATVDKRFRLTTIRTKCLLTQQSLSCVACGRSRNLPAQFSPRRDRRR